MKQFLLFLLFGFSFLFSQTQQRATFYPSPTNTYDLGTSSYYWNNSYIRYGNFVYVFLGSDTAATKAYARSLSGGGLSGYVPYTGASSDLNLGVHTITSGTITSSGLLGVTVASGYAATFMGGNVGIGTTSPGAKLDVYGTNGEFQITDGGYLYGGYRGGSFAIQAASWTNGNMTLTPYGASGGMYINYGGTAGNGGTHIFDGNNTERVTILSNGNVGIGTINPLSKLSINGGLHVGGDSDAGDNNLLVDGTITSGTLTVGSISGVVKQSSGLQSCVTNATGYLYNDGVGNFSYATPAGAGTIVASDTTILHNEIAAKGVGTIIASDTTILHNEIAAKVDPSQVLQVAYDATISSGKGTGTGLYRGTDDSVHAQKVIIPTDTTILHNEIAAKGIGTIVASDTTILHNEIAAKGVGTIVASDTTILHNEIAAKGVGTIVAADTTIIHNEIVGLRGIDTTRAVAREGLLMTLVQRGTDTVRAVAREGLLAPLISPSFTTPALGTPSAGALGSCTATTQTGGDNSTKLATTAYTDAATPNSTYRKILSAQGYIIATKVAGTYMIGVMDSVVKSGNSRLQPLAMINYLAADYPTVNNKTTKLRVVGILSVNNTAPSANFTLGLYPVTSGAGGAGLKIYSVGSVVTGSAPTILNTPAGSSMTVITGSDFTPPADGIYCIGIITSATIATSSLVEINASLQVHNP